MNVASHFLMAIFCQIIINLLFPIEWWSLLLVAVVAFLSHFFIDAIVERFTFHPRFPDKHPKAVLITTICEIILGIIVALYFSQFWLSILFSVVVDIYDWIILRAILKKDFKEDYKLYLHQYCDKIQDTLLDNAWNLNEEPKGFIVEILFISAMWIINTLLINI